jgi:hypothetical protein
MQQVSFGVWEKDDRRVFAATHSGNDRTGEKMDIASYGKQKTSIQILLIRKGLNIWSRFVWSERECIHL